jgi:hypothetical protein
MMKTGDALASMRRALQTHDNVRNPQSPCSRFAGERARGSGDKEAERSVRGSPPSLPNDPA